MLVVLGAVSLALAGCGAASTGVGSSSTTTTFARASSSVTTVATSAAPSGLPVASPKPVQPIAADPTIPLPGVCTQSETSSTCPPSPEPDAALFVGLTEERAAAEAVNHGWGFRVAERDGEQLLLTQDYASDRVNVAVRGGTVERAWFG
jgi:hypothetical protein